MDCRYDLYNVEHPNKTDTLPSLWERTIIPMDNGHAIKYGKDCEYNVLNNEYTVKYIKEEYNFYMHFTMVQSSCQHRLITTSESTLPDDLFKGGASFDILWESVNYLVACSTIDHFNDTYSVYCPVKLTHELLSGTSTKECGNINVKLQFEHFDAFDNKGSMKFS